MNRKIYIIFIVSVFYSFSASAQNEILKDGFHVFKYPNGSISSEGYIKAGKPDGYWKSYYVNGVLKSEGKRRNHFLDSIWVFYSQTGDTIEKIDYLQGKKSGYYFKYKRDKTYGLYICSVELFAGNKREGSAYVYFADSKIKQVIPYNDGKKQGLSKEYDEHGNLITLYEYKNDFLISREKINRVNKDGLKQGGWKEFYGNGNVKIERTYRDDLLHGYYKEYNEKGVLTLTMLYENGSIVEENFDDDPEIEIQNRYDNNGNLIYSGPFRLETPVGIHRDYNESGIVISAAVYNDKGVIVSRGIISEEGQRNGKWENLYENGGFKEKGEYTNNRRSGNWIFYNKTGRIVQKGQYRNGRPEGLWQWFYIDASVLREEQYYQGKRDGTFSEFSKEGEIISSGDYLDSEKNGFWQITIGDHKEEGSYIIGLRDGEWKYYDSDNNLMYKGVYVQGNPDRRHFYYYDNGNVKEEQYYDMGLKHRTWKKYNEDGLLLLTITYKNDIEKRINGVKVNLPESDVKIIK